MRRRPRRRRRRRNPHRLSRLFGDASLAPPRCEHEAGEGRRLYCPVALEFPSLAQTLRRRNRSFSRIRATLCVIARRHAVLSALIMRMPPRHARQERRNDHDLLSAFRFRAGHDVRGGLRAVNPCHIPQAHRRSCRCLFRLPLDRPRPRLAHGGSRQGPAKRPRLAAAEVVRAHVGVGGFSRPGAGNPRLALAARRGQML
jgi:hypothetical protein